MMFCGKFDVSWPSGSREEEAKSNRGRRKILVCDRVISLQIWARVSQKTPLTCYTTHIVQGFTVGGVVVLRQVGKLGFLQSNGYEEVDLFGSSWNSVM